jgi:hypothetical protein
MWIYIILATLLGIILLIIAKKTFAYFYLFTLYLTEFYWLNLWGGILKPFHLLSAFLFVIYSFLRLVRLNSKLLLSFILFFAFQGIYVLLIGLPFEESRTLLLYATLLTISINIFFLLRAGALTEEALTKITLYSIIIIEIVGGLQYFGWRIFSLNLAFTESQKLQLSIAHRYSSFFTEADNCGKFLTYAQLIVFPALLSRKRKSSIILIGVIMTLFLLNMTRTAIGSFILALTTGYLFLNIASKSQQTSHLRRILWVSFLSILILLFVLSFTDLGIIFQQRIMSLLNIKETFERDPALYPRIETAITPINIILSSNFTTMFFGKGWGKAYMTSFGSVKGSSNIFSTFLYFSGIVGLVFIIFVFAYSIRITLKVINKKVHPELATGTFLALLASIYMGLVSSNIIAPEFWVLIGIVAYFERELKRTQVNYISSTAKIKKHENPHHS